MSRWQLNLIAAGAVLMISGCAVTVTVSPVDVQHTSSAAKPTSIQQSGQLPATPYDAVAVIYLFPAEGIAPDKSCLIFTASAAKSFGQAFGASSCAAAFTKIASQITDKDAYSEPDTSRLPSNPTGNTITVDSCDLGVTGGPRLGTFTVTHLEKGWQITGYQAQRTCP
ncbi:MAG TPA: hypothetical protein VGN81_38895 [Pseudonocardiaceae bacterium]|jgi:hypothetical protein